MFFLPQFRFNYINIFLLNTLKNINIDVSSRVSSKITIIKNINITVRENTFIGSNCCFNGAVGSTVSIGKNCDISDYVHFVTGTHEINTKESGLRRAGKGCFKNIEIEEYYKYISPKLMTSPLVKSAISFHIAFNHDDVLSFFQFINSENYLVRMMVANLSDCFIETDFSENILNLLIERNKIEDFVAIKEILSSRIKQYRNN